MTKEYLFVSEIGKKLKLDDSIDVKEKIDNDSDYIVSNIKDAGEIYAPEINFYARNSEDDEATKAKNIKKLYDVRGIVYDYSLDMDYTQEVGNEVIVVSDEDTTEFEKMLKDAGFKATQISPKAVTGIDGYIGDLTVTLGDTLVKTHQMVWITDKYPTDRSGIFHMRKSISRKVGKGEFLAGETTYEGMIDRLSKNHKSYKYKNIIKYDSKICQYHKRTQVETCAKCEEVCGATTIKKIDTERRFEFTHIDCFGCGGCISVCPSGALDYTQMPKAAFTDIAQHFKDCTVLILPRVMPIDDLNLTLPKGVIPLAIEGEKYLHETHFMNLLQTSGNPILFYNDMMSMGSGNVIRILNDIFDKKYGKKAIYVSTNEDELKRDLENLENNKIDIDKFELNENKMRKREVFSARLAHLIGKENLGTIETGPHVHYANLKVDADKCTLCLSCAGGCNIEAFTIDKENKTLNLNPSICTSCGFCVAICPEDAITLNRDEMELAPDYFKTRVVAQDEMFKCVECNTEFATKKAIERVAAMMTPIFGGDEVKIKTLYCCADCKAKVTLKAQLEQMYDRK